MLQGYHHSALLKHFSFPCTCPLLAPVTSAGREQPLPAVTWWWLAVMSQWQLRADIPHDPTSHEGGKADSRVWQENIAPAWLITALSCLLPLV